MPARATARARTLVGTVRAEPGAALAPEGQPVTLYLGAVSGDVCPGDTSGGAEGCDRPGRPPDPALPRPPPRQKHAGARAEPVFAPSREELNLERIFQN